MSPPSPSERSHLPNPQTYGPGRSSSSRSAPSYSAPQPVRPAPYSSLGDALGGGGRQSQYIPPDAPYPPPPSSAGAGSLSSYPHVSSEGRYYYTASGMPTSTYEYQYQSSSYEPSSQYTHSTLPPMRSASPGSHPPPPQSSSHHTTSHTPYASPFSQPQYTAPNLQQQWADEQWAPTSSSFSPDPTDPMFAAGRSDPAQSPQPDVRGYASQPYSSTPVNTRVDERAYNISPKSKGKARERDVAPIDRRPAGELAPVPLDYSKLFNTYKNLFTDCESYLTGRADFSKRSSLDDVNRLIESANYGLRMLNNASPIADAKRRHSGDSLASAEPENPSPAPAPKRQVEAAPNTEGQTCLGCGATSTPEWRRGPLGPRTLCNACGLVYAKLIKKRSREVAANALTTPSQAHAAPQSSIIEDAPAALHSPSNEDSEDEHYGQPDPA